MWSIYNRSMDWTKHQDHCREHWWGNRIPSNIVSRFKWLWNEILHHRQTSMSECTLINTELYSFMIMSQESISSQLATDDNRQDDVNEGSEEPDGVAVIKKGKATNKTLRSIGARWVKIMTMINWALVHFIAQLLTALYQVKLKQMMSWNMIWAIAVWSPPLRGPQ